MNFTSEQINIFNFVELGTGNGIIDVVAGAGKTTTIMECARFVKSSDALFCAFNKSISKEIGAKLSERGFSRVTVKTIHALGWQMLNANNFIGKPIKIDETKYDKILRSIEMQNALKPYFEKIIIINGLQPELVEEDKYEAFAIKNLMFRITRRLLEIIRKYRSTLTRETIEDFKNMVVHFGLFNDIEVRKAQFEQELDAYFQCTLRLIDAGNDLSRRTMVMDFTDMIYLPFVWKLPSTVKYDFLFVDECQDLSRAQLAIVTKFGHAQSRVLAVGDPRQSIYGFTGADIESFDQVKRITQATQFPLTSCFRCPKKVIELAQTIREDIVGTNPNSGTVTRISPDQVVSFARAGDLIISRLREPLLIQVFTFIDKDRKVQIHEDDVKEVIAEVKDIFKREELLISLHSVAGSFTEMKNVVFNRWKWIIQKDAERIMDSVERMVYVENRQEYLKQRLEFIHRKIEQWKQTCPTLSHIIERIREYVSATVDSVKLSTIHKAKGLENDRVFILNYDELPLQHVDQKDWQKTQELNLKYVAVTRAKKELILVEAEKIEVLKEKSLFDILPFDNS